MCTFQMSWGLAKNCNNIRENCIFSACEDWKLVFLKVFAKSKDNACTCMCTLHMSWGLAKNCKKKSRKLHIFCMWRLKTSLSQGFFQKTKIVHALAQAKCSGSLLKIANNLEKTAYFLHVQVGNQSEFPRESHASYTPKQIDIAPASRPFQKSKCWGMHKPWFTVKK